MKKIETIDLRKIDFTDKENVILAFSVICFTFGLGILGLIISLISVFIVKRNTSKKISYACVGLSAFKLIFVVIVLFAFTALKNYKEDSIADINNSYNYDDYYDGYGDYYSEYDPFSDFYDMFPDVFGDSGSIESSPEDYS